MRSRVVRVEVSPVTCCLHERRTRPSTSCLLFSRARRFRRIGRHHGAGVPVCGAAQQNGHAERRQGGVQRVPACVCPSRFLPSSPRHA